MLVFCGVMSWGVEMWLSDVVCWFCGGWGRGVGFFGAKFVWCSGSDVVVFGCVVYGGVVSYVGSSIMSAGGGLVPSRGCNFLSWV